MSEKERSANSDHDAVSRKQVIDDRLVERRAKLGQIGERRH
jgi:hypothetical protein